MYLENNVKEMTNEEVISELLNTSNLNSDILQQLEQNLRFKLSKNPNISKDELTNAFTTLARALQ